MSTLPNLHQNREEFALVIQETAHRLGIDESMAEKDYWVTWCINYLFAHSQWKDHLAFKGGTCMSKAYGLIDRFSEDIDVILDWRLLGYEKSEPLRPSTISQRERFKKKINQLSCDFLAETMLPVIQNDISLFLGSEFKVTLSDENPPSIHFHYPKIFTQNPYILSSVKLEIGPLSQWSQLGYQLISSMIDGVFPEVNIFAPIPVLSVSPERNFWEKISILQNISHLRDKDEQKPMGIRTSRHYYDVYKILKSPYKKRCVEQSQLFYDAMDFSARFYRVNTFDQSNAKLSDLQLTIPASLMSDLRSDYHSMTSMLYGDKPSFDEIYDTILKFQEEIRQKEKGTYKKLDDVISQARIAYKQKSTSIDSARLRSFDYPRK